MLNELLLHPVTKEALLAVAQSQPHAVLLRGKPGAGKGFTARVLAADVLGCLPDDLEKQPYFKPLVPDNGTISIEQVRELKQFLQLKTTGQAGIRRVVVLEDVMAMGDEAQNALLKLLEEPPADTMIILTSTYSTAVRPTVLSRSQVIAIQNPPQDMIVEYFQLQGSSQMSMNRALAISQGSVGLMQALLNNEEHPLLVHINLAKDILKDSVYQRLVRVDKLAKDRLAIEALLEALGSICNAAIQQAAKTNNTTNIKRWYRSLRAVDRANQALAYKPSGKLLLTDLFLQL